MEMSEDVLKLGAASNGDFERLRRAAIDSVDTVDRITEPISYSDFFRRYLIQNVPCIFSDWVTSDWLCRSVWCKNDTIQWDILEQQCGKSIVPVVNCTDISDYDQPKVNMIFADFIHYMKELKRQNSDSVPEQRIPPCNVQRLYLKDWHFVRDHPSYEAYKTPVYFASDWLNEFWESRTDCFDDYRFLYIGPAGTWTPFHADVFRSFSWSANVCGKKKWIIYPAGSEVGLINDRGLIPHDVSMIQNQFDGEHIKRFEVIQNAGEVIFIPSGWHHQVYNMEDTISFNHNWLNGCNVDICWTYIETCLAEVCKEISEHRETMENWHQHCQLMLKANCGIDYIEFYNFLHKIAWTRINILSNRSFNESTDNSCKLHCETSTSRATDNFYSIIDGNHAIFDLLRIRWMLTLLASSSSFKDVLTTDLKYGLLSQSQDLLISTNETLSRFIEINEM